MNWYYQCDGKARGPVPEATFRSLIADGSIRPDTLVWHDGMSEWVQLAVAAPAFMSRGGFGPPPIPEFFVPTSIPATNAELKARARSYSDNNYWTFGGGLFLWLILDILAGILLPVIGSFIINWCLADYSYSYMGLRGADHRKLTIKDAFISFPQFGRAFACGWLTTIYTILWGLLLIVPGIIKSISYSFTAELMIEHPDWTVAEAITESQRLMDGNKWRAVCLLFSFSGWWLVGIVLYGIMSLLGGGCLAVMAFLVFVYFRLLPYMCITFGAFYRAVVYEKGPRPTTQEA